MPTESQLYPDEVIKERTKIIVNEYTVILMFFLCCKSIFAVHKGEFVCPASQEVRMCCASLASGVVHDYFLLLLLHQNNRVIENYASKA